MIIIGISGKAKSGKTTIADILRHKIKNEVSIINFADALKDEVAEACKVPRDFIDTNKDIFRPILQWWGTEFRRGLTSKDYWVNRLMERIYKSPTIPICLLIPDVRFLNEADWIKQFDTGYLIRVIRRQNMIKESSHTSETELDNYSKFDFTIDNSFGLDVLEKEAISLIKQINKLNTPKHYI